jgi:cytochrome c biogenesis protein CcmG/thiol:disulfide interchange protein DsbE
MKFNTSNPMKFPIRAYALMIAGVGLIVIGITSWLYLASRPANDPTQPTDFSAVPAKVQYAAPLLTLKDSNGTAVSLANYRGQVVLVNLWATWCPPCKAEMPLLQKYFTQHKDQGFTVVAIDDGDPTPDVISFINDYDLTFPVWLDPTYQATDHAFKTKNLPSSFVIDRTGTVRLAWIGAIDTSNLEKFVTPLIKEQ